MLKLQKEQVDAFKLQALQQFLEQATKHLRLDLTEQTEVYTDAQLGHRVRSIIPRAGKYGLKTQREIMCFVDVSFLLGEHFDTDSSQPWATDLLNSKKLSSGDRANLLLATACSVYRDIVLKR